MLRVLAAWLRMEAAGTEYAAAEDPASVLGARGKVELYGTLFPAAAVIGGLGFVLSPVLLSGGPDPEALQRSINSFDEQIRKLPK
jgi:hypothetical protein